MLARGAEVGIFCVCWFLEGKGRDRSVSEGDGEEVQGRVSPEEWVCFQGKARRNQNQGGCKGNHGLVVCFVRENKKKLLGVTLCVCVCVSRNYKKSTKQCKTMSSLSKKFAMSLGVNHQVIFLTDINSVCVCVWELG